MRICLAGNGKMAQELESVAREKKVEIKKFLEVNQWDSSEINECVAIHFGSGREFPELLKWCEYKNIPLIQGSTRGVTLPEKVKTSLIIAPNLSLPVVRLMNVYNILHQVINPSMQFSITESHQHPKLDTSGTARAVAAITNTPESEIQIIRNTGVQLALKVPQEYLEGHAYHFFNYSGLGAEIGINIRIHGRRTYAEGALEVAEALVRNPVPTGVRKLKDILPAIFG